MSYQPAKKRKRFLAPQEKYEIWMQLVRGEITVAEAAGSAGVDRSTIAKLREVARQGAPRCRLWSAQRWEAPQSVCRAAIVS